MKRFKRTAYFVSLCGLFSLGRCADRGPEVHFDPVQGFMAPTFGGGLTQAYNVSDHEAERRSCEARLREVMEQPASPGAPTFEKNRVDIFMKAKGEPVLFVEAPDYVNDDVSPGVQAYRQLVNATSYPWDALGKLGEHFTYMPEHGRQTLLKNGYFYADTPKLAHALVSRVQVEQLFNQKRIWLQRGENTYFAERKYGKYYFVDGPLKGERVRLLHLDRLGVGVPDSKPLHRDIRSLRYRLGFNNMEVRHIDENNIVANLRYGKWWVPSVLRSEGAHLELECEVVDASIAADVEHAKREALRRERSVQSLRVAMQAQIAEGLPFDEPIHEFGKQFDGKLRENWRWAYYNQESRYEYNGDRYQVFNSDGQPLVPQVCVDFLTDTFERASGTWYRPKGKEPGRSMGGMDFDVLDVHGADLRRAPGFLEFAEERPHWFDVYHTPPNQRLPMKKQAEFYQYLSNHTDLYQPGDIVIIHGWCPWDRHKRHYHSFFIYESDPETGTPIDIVGNAGTPSVRVWEIEARRTPRRMIRYRIRPTLAFLEGITEGQKAPSLDPMELSPPGSRD